MKAVLVLPLVLAGCAAGLSHPATLPPAEFDHPFPGTVVEHTLPPGAMSLAVRDPLRDGFTGIARCDVFIVPGLAPEARATLRRIEEANCNGWARQAGDLNDWNRR